MKKHTLPAVLVPGCIGSSFIPVVMKHHRLPAERARAAKVEGARAQLVALCDSLDSKKDQADSDGLTPESCRHAVLTLMRDGYRYVKHDE